MRPYRTDASRGFTLIEAMLVVALVGVLATLSYSYGMPGARRRAFDSAVMGLRSACTAAKQNAMRTGVRSMVSIDGGAIVAFVDNDGNRAVSAGDVILQRYPTDAGSSLPSGLSVTGATLPERAGGPATAVFDARGFYVDGTDGVSRHDADLCVQDSVQPRSSNVRINRFGATLVTVGSCAAQAPCPLAGP